MSGLVSYLKGAAAEDTVAAAYVRNGFEIVERRWKTKSGEIDVIAKNDEKYYFVEVKCSKNYTEAVERISARQQQRIQNAALEFFARNDLTQDTDCRFDAALVDAAGRVKVLTNAFVCE